MRFVVAFILVFAALAGCSENTSEPDEELDGPIVREDVQVYQRPNLTTGDDEKPEEPPSDDNETVEPQDPEEVMDEELHEIVPFSVSTSWFNSGFDGAEPNVGVFSNDRIVASAFELVIASDDGGETWHEVYDFASPGVDVFSNSDPMLWVDPVTDIAYDAPMFPVLLCATLVTSEDQGESWLPHAPTCPIIEPFDRQTISTGLPGPNAPPIAGLAHETVVYICYNQLLSTSCLTSYDGGLTFPNNQIVWNGQMDGSGSCAGQNGHPMASDDGTLVVPKSWFCPGLLFVVSEDNGLTWDVREGPKLGGDTLSPEVAFPPDGNSYALWQGSDHLPYIARSPDYGQTWTGTWNIAPPGVTSTVFVGLTTGDDGRLAAAFLGTEDSDAYPSDVPDETVWNLYIVTSETANEAEPIWTSFQVTDDADPVQRGCVWIGGGGSPCRNMLDFIDSSLMSDGTFIVAYTDGCIECEDASESRAREMSLARLDGWSLYADVLDEADAPEEELA